MAFEPKENEEPKGDDWKARKEELSGNSVVRRPIPRVDKSIGKRRKTGGREKKYTVTRMRNGINKYFGRCEERDEMPTIKGLMIYLKMDKFAFYRYLEYPEFTDLLEHTRMIISHWAEMDVYHTKGMAAGKVAYMKNIHAWSDKIETKNETTQKVITVDDAKAKIAALAPKLMELLSQSPETVKQLAQGRDEKIEDAEIVEDNPRRV